MRRSMTLVLVIGFFVTGCSETDIAGLSAQVGDLQAQVASMAELPEQVGDLQAQVASMTEQLIELSATTTTSRTDTAHDNYVSETERNALEDWCMEHVTKRLVGASTSADLCIREADKFERYVNGSPGYKPEKIEDCYLGFIKRWLTDSFSLTSKTEMNNAFHRCDVN